MSIRTVDTSLDSPFTLDSWSGDLTSITNQFVRMLLLDVEGYFLYTNFVSISQRIFWQNICFWCFIWHHAWFSRADFDNLRYGSQGFFIRKFLTVNLLTVRTIDTSLNRALTLNSWCCDLATPLWNLICVLLLNRKINLFYSNLIICSQFQLRVLMNRSCLGTGSVLCQLRNFVNRSCFRSCAIFRQFRNFMN